MPTIVRAHDESAVSVCWRSDGGIVTGSLDGSIALWRYDPDAETKALEEQASQADSKGKKDSGVLTSSRKLERAHHLGVASICTDPAGNRMVSSGISSEVHIWDLSSYSKVKTIDTTPADVWKLAYSPIAAQFASGGQGGVVNIFNAETGEKDASVPTGSDFINTVAYSPDGKFVAAGSVDGSISLVDVEARAVASRVHKAHLLPVQSVSFSSDGATLYSGSYDRSIHVYDVSSIGSSGSSSSSSSSAPAVSTTGLICSLMGHLHWVTCVAASPATSHHIASASADRSVRVWDARKREQVHSFEGHAERVWGVSWNAAGTRLATVTDAGALGLFPVSAFV